MRSWFPFKKTDDNKLWACFQCGPIVPANQRPFCISKRTGPSDTDPIIIQAVSVHDLKGVVTQACQLRTRGIA
eukprot:6357086-Karenia_brevis.AAC.1